MAAEPNGLLLAITLVERKRDEATRMLAHCQQQVHAARQQMHQLQSYAGDIDARWLRTGAVGLSVEMIQHHVQFAHRLQQAIGMQEGVIAQLQRQADGAQTQVHRTQARLTGLQQVLAQRRAQAAQNAMRREQAAMDEMAAQLFVRHRAQVSEGSLQ